MNKSILIVEDDEKNLYLVKFILEKAGYKIYSARDGAEGFAAAVKFLPDLILMDMQLPVMDGFAATAKLKSNQDTSMIPVVALTAYAMHGDKEKVLDAGCDDYLQKPINPETFTETISQLFQKLVKKE